MNNETRTSKSIKNAKVALIYYFINLILQFFSRKIFLEYLGAEVLGLNTTAMNLLQFLNLAELGISAAVGYSLYTPLANKDKLVINEIVSVQGFLYRRIGFIILGGAIVLMCFFPWIFEKVKLPFWYTYATFIVLLINALAGYFFNYRQIVLTADQKDYKLNTAVQTIKSGKIGIQILAIIYLNNGYIFWLMIELFAALISVLAINFVLKKEYPWLNSNPSQGKLLKIKYPLIIKKTKQLFFHRIAEFVLNQTSPLIIYGYSSLAIVSIFGNYMLIITGITALLGAIFNSIGAGIGNLVSEGNKQKMLRIFEELFSFRFWLACTVCFGVYKLASPFIDLWVGKEYRLDNLSLLLMTMIMYINLMRAVVDTYINALGLYKDIWAPITEAFLNISLSILFGHYWGIAGILGGVFVSLILIIFLWKPWFMFSRGMHFSFNLYIVLYIKHILAFTITYILSSYLINHISNYPKYTYIDLLKYGTLIISIFGIILFILLYTFNLGIRNIALRIISIIKNKK